MGSSVLERECELRREAEQLFGPRGLRKLLTEFGSPRVEGSYALRLMTWRDLDIYLVNDSIDVASFFRLGGRLAELLLPHRMSHRNERIANTPGLPHGLYWGIYLGDEREGAWKIDVWAIDSSEYHRLSQFREEIASRLTDENRLTILEIKEQCWRDPQGTAAPIFIVLFSMMGLIPRTSLPHG